MQNDTRTRQAQANQIPPTLRKAKLMGLNMQAPIRRIIAAQGDNVPILAGMQAPRRVPHKIVIWK